MDGRVAGGFAGGIGDRVVGPDRSADVDHAEQGDREDRQDEGELEERLAAFPRLAAAVSEDHSRPCATLNVARAVISHEPFWVMNGQAMIGLNGSVACTVADPIG